MQLLKRKFNNFRTTAASSNRAPGTACSGLSAHLKPRLVSSPSRQRTALGGCFFTEAFYFMCSYRRNYGDIELLFQLLRAFTGRFLCNMTFLKEYMEEDIPKNYSIPQKRALFFRFVDFNDPNFGDELKAKVTKAIKSKQRGI